MTDKPKISRFAAIKSPQSKLSKASYPDRSKLAQLYPKPKTYEQRNLDDKLRQRSYRRRWPKYPSFSIAMYGSILFSLIILFILSLNIWWFSNPGNSGATMSIVFSTFLLGLGLMFLIITWVRFVNEQFSYFGGLLRLFWLIYSAVLVGIITVWLSSWIGNYTSILSVPSIAILHFIIVFFSAARILGRTSSTE